MFDTIKQKYKYYRDRVFLKRHGCKTWAEYNRRHDPDYNIRATRIKDIYHGYPYVHCFENHKHEGWDFGYDVSYVVTEWCEGNLCDKFRFDSHRVDKCVGSFGEWEVNELGGGDYIFAAFKSESDYLWFLLRWT